MLKNVLRTNQAIPIQSMNLITITTYQRNMNYLVIA